MFSFLLIGAFLSIGCASRDGVETPAESAAAAAHSVAVHTAAAPSEDERFCAWFGDRRGSVFYAGLSAFWSEYWSAGNDPRADLRSPGPALIGRFDLDVERWLEPLSVGHDDPSGDFSGVWDVLAHPNGRIYFTTFFGSAGWIDPATGERVRLDEAGPFLNELGLGPDGHWMATRYSAPEERSSGALVIFDEAGHIVAEWQLRAGPGRRLAPKSLAYDPLWQEVWLTTDLLDAAGGALPDSLPRGQTRPALVIGLDGIQRTRIEEVEVQFVVFGSDGSGYLAVLGGPDDRVLSLVGFPADDPSRDLASAPRVLLDPNFPSRTDFVQDIRPDEEGRIVITRWSGRIHVVEPLESGFGAVREIRLPPVPPRGLYYTAVVNEDRICASHCGEVNVVCAQAPSVLR